jgi:hypothetical protein
MKISINKITITISIFALITSILVTFVIKNALSGTTPTAQADTPTSEYAPYLGKTVNFCGNKWDVIGIADGDTTGTEYLEGSSKADGTIPEPNSAMLLLHNGDSSGNITLAGMQTAFNASGSTHQNTNIYDESTLQTKMEDQAYICAANLDRDLDAAGVLQTKLQATDFASQSIGEDVVSSTGNNITGQYFFPLSFNEANLISSGLRIFSLNSWWLRSPGNFNSYASDVVGANGSVNRNGQLATSSYVDRPALQISLSSFLPPREAKALSTIFATSAGTSREDSKETLTLANRKYDVIGANALVQPTDVPVIGDPGTVALLYSKENVDNNVTPGPDTDTTTSVTTDTNMSLITDFNNNNSPYTATNEYLGSLLQDFLDNWYTKKFGSNAQSQVQPRDLPTQPNSVASHVEAYSHLATTPIYNQHFWPLSYNEALAITGSPDGTDETNLRAFPSGWWLRSPDTAFNHAAGVFYSDGQIQDYPVICDGCVARPALQTSQTSDLLKHFADGTNAISLGDVSGESTVGVGAQTDPFTAEALDGDGAYTYELTWTSSNENAATVDAETGIVTGQSDTADNESSGDAAGATKICAETAAGEWKRCATLQVLPLAEIPAPIINISGEILTDLTPGDDNYVYCIDTAGTCTPSTPFSGTESLDLSAFGLPDANEAKKLRIVLVGTPGVSFDSDPVTLDIPARLAAPTIIATQPTSVGGNGTLTGTTTDHQYVAYDETSCTSASDANCVWQDATANQSVPPGTYYVRIKATFSNFASLPTGAIIVIPGSDDNPADDPADDPTGDNPTDPTSDPAANLHLESTGLPISTLLLLSLLMLLLVIPVKTGI